MTIDSAPRTDSIKRSAVLSEDGKYRYRLEREWNGRDRWEFGGGPVKNTITFIMLNPSTADAEKDDATIRRCVGFAKAWGYGKLIVVNLFAYRTTYPRDLLDIYNDGPDIAVGPDNEEHVLAAAQASYRVVAAWGQHAPKDYAVRIVEYLESKKIDLWCLALTKAGQPGHPLRLPKDSLLHRYRLKEALGE